MNKYREYDAEPPRKHPRTGLPMRQYICHEDGCDKSPDCPMLKESVWLTIGSKDTLLCIRHTEQRLGRQISMDDLSRCNSNSFTFLVHDRLNKETA